MSEQKDDQKQPTLTEFINENSNLISTFAIFAALSAFANDLPDKDAGKILSFLTFALALMVGLEVVLKHPGVRRGRLHWFRETLFITMALFGFAWVQMYYPYLIGFGLMVLGLIIIVLVFALWRYAIQWATNATPWLKQMSNRTRDELIPTFGGLVLMWITLEFLRRLISR